MDTLSLIVLAVTLGVLIYLLAVLFMPEAFS